MVKGAPDTHELSLLEQLASLDAGLPENVGVLNGNRD
jgi:hypothetical protein